VQRGTGPQNTLFECNLPGSLTSGLQLSFTVPECAPTTPTVTPTPLKLLVAHVIEQGCPTSANPITLTLKNGATEVNYPPQAPDASGFFTVNVTSLPGNTYQWRSTGPRYLANAGNVFIPDTASTTQLEVGLLLAGDINNDNITNIADFNLLKLSFGLQTGDPGYNSNADFTCDGIVNIFELNMLKVNFNRVGAGQVTPRR
jgi:hypothetical protein